MLENINISYSIMLAEFPVKILIEQNYFQICI